MCIRDSHWERAALLLAKLDDEATVPHSDGLSAKRLRLLVDEALRGAQ